MALTICELTWLTQLLKELGLKDLPITVVLKCDNKVALSIIVNPVQHERTKHVEIDSHYVKDKVQDGSIHTEYVPTQDKVSDMFTKPVHVAHHKHLMRKLGVLVEPPLPT